MVERGSLLTSGVRKMDNQNEKKAIKAYIIYVNLNEFSGTVDQLNEFIVQNKNVLSWWNYIPSIYIVTSHLSAKELKESVMKFTGDGTDLLVLQIYGSNYSGLLSKGAWPAYQKDIRDVIKNQSVGE